MIHRRPAAYLVCCGTSRRAYRQRRGLRFGSPAQAGDHAARSLPAERQRQGSQRPDRGGVSRALLCGPRASHWARTCERGLRVLRHRMARAVCVLVRGRHRSGRLRQGEGRRYREHAAGQSQPAVRAGASSHAGDRRRGTRRRRAGLAGVVCGDGRRDLAPDGAAFALSSGSRSHALQVRSRFRIAPTLNTSSPVPIERAAGNGVPVGSRSRSP